MQIREGNIAKQRKRINQAKPSLKGIGDIGRDRIGRSNRELV
jgi:hypothetical protein